MNVSLQCDKLEDIKKCTLWECGIMFMFCKEKSHDTLQWTKVLMEKYLF